LPLNVRASFTLSPPMNPDGEAQNIAVELIYYAGIVFTTYPRYSIVFIE